MKLKWKWLPAWNMPSDPVRAVFWFLHWLLQVLVRYFAILILAGVTYETYLNGFVGLVGTLLVGVIVWACLALLLAFLNATSRLSTVYSEVSRLQNNAGLFGFSDFTSRSTHAEEEENVVEGSIITDLGEERKRRRQEM